jgi:transposase
VTALDRLLAATAAARLGLAPRVVHRDTTSVHVDGRSHRDEAPAAQVVPSTRGESRDQRPDLTQVMVERMVEHQAGSPLLMPPRSGTSRATQEFGAAMRRQGQQWPATDGRTSLVAARALYREANRAHLAQTPMQWSTRVPAPLRDAPAVLAPADPPALGARQEG